MKKIKEIALIVFSCICLLGPATYIAATQDFISGAFVGIYAVLSYALYQIGRKDGYRHGHRKGFRDGIEATHEILPQILSKLPENVFQGLREGTTVVTAKVSDNPKDFE